MLVYMSHFLFRFVGAFGCRWALFISVELYAFFKDYVLIKDGMIFLIFRKIVVYLSLFAFTKPSKAFPQLETYLF